MSVEFSEIPAGMHIRQVADDDLQFLAEVADLVDRRLDALEEEIDRHPDPDGWGVLYSWDSTAGLGFVACQNYLAAVIGKGDRKRCLPLGPSHAAGDSIASILNAGANYVKHHGEARPLDDRHVVILRRLGVWGTNPEEQGDSAITYPLGNLLFEMLKPGPARFRELLPLLEQWRDAVLKAGFDA